MNGLNEFDFIKKITPKTYRQSSLQMGIGDDAAVFSTDQNIVTAVDTFVENIHFSKQTTKPFHIGYKALAANVSDMAAMGATPAFYLVSVAIPDRLNEDELTAIFSGMTEFAKLYHMDLIGGDTVSGATLTISITVIGFTEKNKTRYRSHAKEHDIVFVTGTLGDSQAGFHLLMEKQDAKDSHFFIQRHQMPEPRVKFASALSLCKRVALNDVSDGIGNELYEIASRSQVNMMISDKYIPVHPSLSQFTKQEQQRWKLFGGEDYELIGTVPEVDWQTVKQTADRLSLQVTQIGRVIPTYFKASPKVFLKKMNNEIIQLSKQGYTHLK